MSMSQTRLGSLIEALVHTAVGFLTSYVGGLFIYPLVGFRPSLAQNLAIVLLFTVVSVVRGYVVRRWFNARLQRAALRLASGLQGGRP